MNTPDWIPFTEGFTPSSISVASLLVAGKNGYFYIREYHQIVCGVNTRNWYTLNDIDELVPITHWKYISSPKPEEN